MWIVKINGCPSICKTGWTLELPSVSLPSVSLGASFIQVRLILSPGAAVPILPKNASLSSE